MSCTSPSSEALIFTRKRTREKQLEPYSEAEVLEETHRNKIPRQSVVNPSSEPREPEDNGLSTNKCMPPNHHITARSLVTTIESGPPPESEESTFKTLTEESIFDHIRRKSKNFPVINKLKTMDFESLLWTKDSSESLAMTGSAASEILKEMNPDEVLRDMISTSDLEPREVEKDAFVSKDSTEVKHNIYFGSSYGSLNLPPKVSSTNADLSSIKMLSFDISMSKNEEQLADPVSSMKSSSKQQCSSRESKRQQCSPNEFKRLCCSLETASETKEAESFLGFKSVFSFL